MSSPSSKLRKTNISSPCGKSKKTKSVHPLKIRRVRLAPNPHFDELVMVAHRSDKTVSAADFKAATSLNETGNLLMLVKRQIREVQLEVLSNISDYTIEEKEKVASLSEMYNETLSLLLLKMAAQ